MSNAKAAAESATRNMPSVETLRELTADELDTVAGGSVVNSYYGIITGYTSSGYPVVASGETSSYRGRIIGSNNSGFTVSNAIG
jgi:hypothetical protein